MRLEPAEQTFQLALFTVFSLLVTELARQKAIDLETLITTIEATAAHQREVGNKFLADYLHTIAQKIIPPTDLGIFDKGKPGTS